MYLLKWRIGNIRFSSLRKFSELGENDRKIQKNVLISKSFLIFTFNTILPQYTCSIMQLETLSITFLWYFALVSMYEGGVISKGTRYLTSFAWQKFVKFFVQQKIYFLTYFRPNILDKKNCQRYLYICYHCNWL